MDLAISSKRHGIKFVFDNLPSQDGFRTKLVGNASFHRKIVEEFYNIKDHVDRKLARIMHKRKRMNNTSDTLFHHTDPTLNKWFMLMCTR